VKARDNPFAVERIHQLRFRLPQISWPQLLARWSALHHRGAIVGPEGHGKTTMLLELAQRLTQENWYVRQALLRRSNSNAWRELPTDLFENLGPRDCILLDGAEQLSFLAWRRFSRHARPAGGLIVTTHRPGRLATWFTCETSVELLDDLVEQLLGSIDDNVRSVNRHLFEKYAGNLRLALREWYDLYAAM